MSSKSALTFNREDLIDLFFSFHVIIRSINGNLLIKAFSI